MQLSFSQLVWLGAHTATEPTDLLQYAKQATLFEARETACLMLRQKFPQKNVTVIQTILTTTNTIAGFTEYNLAEFSAIQPATGLKNLFPGLKAINKIQLTSTAINDAINSLELNDNNNLLIVDIADSSLALLNAIEAAKQLHFFSAIYVQTANEPLYEGAATAADITAFLQTQGYVLQQTLGNDPDLPWLSFGLNPLWNSLQQAQETNNLISAELIQIKLQLSAAQQEVIANKQHVEQVKSEHAQQMESVQAQLNASKQELPKQEARINEISTALTAANKAKQDAEQQLVAIKQQLTATQQELATAKQSIELTKTEHKQQLEAANHQVSASKQELQKQEARLNEINTALAAANKAKQDAEQQLTGIKQLLTAAQQELTTAKQELAQTKTQSQQQTESNVQQALEQKLQKMFVDHAQQITKEVGNIKNHINTGLGNTAKQLEAFMGIQNYLERGIKPLSFHGWPISPDIGLYIAGLIDANNYDVIIEFGSGTSTVLMAKALISKQRNVQTKALTNTSQSNDIALQDKTFTDLPARIVTFEHNSLYHGKTTQALKDNGVDHLVDLVHAPLVDYQYKDSSQYLYYSCNEKLQELAKIFKGRKANILVLVDGPPGATNKNARFPALPHLINNLPEHSFTIIMDDYNRAEEKEIVGIWSKICESRFMSHTTEEIPSEKGLSVIKIG